MKLYTIIYSCSVVFLLSCTAKKIEISKSNNILSEFDLTPFSGFEKLDSSDIIMLKSRAVSATEDYYTFKMKELLKLKTTFYMIYRDSSTYTDRSRCEKFCKH